MKIAVASDHQSHISHHTGKCRHFYIYTVDGDQIVAQAPLCLDPQQTFHASSPQAPHPLDDVQVLICGSVGQGLLRRLRHKAIDVVVTPAEDITAAVRAYLQGSLPQADPETFRQHLHHAGNPATAGCTQA